MGFKYQKKALWLDKNYKKALSYEERNKKKFYILKRFFLFS